jgi:hypothetical protein
MKSHDKAEQLTLTFSSKDLNEANTRHQLIDPLLHDVLGWPRSRVRCEEYISPGFADYVLVRPDDTAILFIEAKREGRYFELPNSLLTDSLFSYVKVKTLLTDESTSAAITQVREYCLNTGCEFAAITNGHQWIFFKTFQTGQDWREIRALVICKIEYFSRYFVEAHNNFSYNSIVEQASLRRLFLDGSIANRELFYPKDRIAAYDAPVDANGYASSLRPITDRYFGPIDVRDTRFMENCYVSDREYDLAFTNARRRIEDALTPFLEQFNVREFRSSEGGGSFGNRIAKNVIGSRPADVVVLFGGKGVGKSTFLRRLLFHRAPHVIEKNGVVAMIDLLHVPPDAQQIQEAIWGGISRALDTDMVLKGARDGLCELFADRFEQAKNQDLFGLDENSEAYNIGLNRLLAEWKKDHAYLTQRLAARVRARHKAVIVNIDNTDQYEDALQELCFSIGQSIASTFPCVVIISMREERFYSSSIRGVLDAYQNSGFHISSPSPKEVFLRRIDYVKQLLQADDSEDLGIPSRVDSETVISFFRILEANFRERSSHLSNFLTACSHGNIRLALELFRAFVVSGYTNVKEMTEVGRWTLQIHQVIKPFMIPSRFFYSESLSKIPNVFQIRSKANGSHFTAMRILSSLLEGYDRQNPPFVPVAKLSMPFIEVFAMKEDFQLNMDMLLKHNLIESNNRLDVFDEKVDSVRITTYGTYTLKALSHDFTYLELTAEDCAISDLATSNEIAALSNDEYRFFTSYKAMERVEVRLQRAESFLRYLSSEEERENQLYRSAMGQLFTRSIREAFDQEKINVLRSARRNVPRKWDSSKS